MIGLKCPICGSVKNEIAEEVKIKDRSLNLYRCENCEVVWSLKTDLEFDYANEKTHYRKELDVVFHYVEEFLKIKTGYSKVNVLEIGCGDGRHIARIKRKYNNLVECYAFDLYLEQKFNFEKFTEDIVLISDFNKLPTKLDIIYLFHVLEHIHEPMEFLEKLKQKLGKNGLLIISVPNPERGSLKLFRRELWDYPPYHLFRFGKHSFEVMSNLINMNLILSKDYRTGIHDIYIYIENSKSFINSILHSIFRKLRHHGNDTQENKNSPSQKSSIRGIKKTKLILIYPYKVMSYFLAFLFFSIAFILGLKGLSLVVVMQKQLSED